MLTVRSGNDDLELIAELTGVGSGLRGDGGVVERALDGSCAWGVPAAWAWDNSWVTLNVDIEGLAVLVGITALAAADGIVAWLALAGSSQGREGNVVGTLLSGALEVLEDLSVALWIEGVDCQVAVLHIVAEGLWSVWRSGRGITAWEGRAGLLTGDQVCWKGRYQAKRAGSQEQSGQHAWMS